MTEAQGLIEAAVKHLPPSGTTLKLLDVSGLTGGILTELRDDIEVLAVSAQAVNWQVENNFADAVVAYNQILEVEFLAASLAALRPGGRLIVVRLGIEASEADVKTLENAGFTRILVENGIEGQEVLLRGEKPHTTDDTLERVRQVAVRESLAAKGRYLHLLIQQTPNKPVWRLEPGEQVTWQAVALRSVDTPVLLAFISLPKAVQFMQQAVLDGKIRDINKVGKFRREITQDWDWPLLLNPDVEAIQADSVTLVSVDPHAAEAPDE